MTRPGRIPHSPPRTRQDALARTERANLEYLREVAAPAADAATQPGARSAVGISRLRRFLEDLLRERYLMSLTLPSN